MRWAFDHCSLVIGHLSLLIWVMVGDLPESVRAFVAIDLPEELLRELRALQARLELELPKNAVRWTPAEQIHLTLKFLGNIASADLDKLEAALAATCQRAKPFRLRAKSLGCFPNPARPRVIWVGLEDELQPLQALQSQIDAATQSWCAKSDERAFRPHLTIGRVREVSPRVSRQIGQTVKGTPISTLGDWTVGEVGLLWSKLSPKGAEHFALARVAFAGDK